MLSALSAMLTPLSAELDATEKLSAEKQRSIAAADASRNRAKAANKVVRESMKAGTGLDRICGPFSARQLARH
jgi:hypothetical protein